MILDFEDFLSMNPPPHRGGISLLNRLMMRGATNERLLCEVAQKLDDYESDGVPHFACFLQLPYKIELDYECIVLRCKQEYLKAKAYFSPASVGYNEKFELQYFDFHKKPKNDFINFTQVVMYLPYWGKRATIYKSYSNCVEENGLLERVLVSRENSWVTVGHKRHGVPMPIFPKDFENNLAWRVHRECHFAIGRFLIELSAQARQELRCPYPLYNFFVMPTSGRVTYNVIPRSIVLGTLENQVDQGVAKGICKKLEKTLEERERKVSQFELQLFSLQKVLYDGEDRLCLIGIISLLEWLFNAAYFENEPKQLSLSKLLRVSELKPLLGKHSPILWRAVEMRNAAVHGAPPSREELFVPSKKKRRLTALGQMSDAKAQVFFTELFEASFDLFRRINMDKGTR